jgi:hypothetical protein
MLVRVTLAEMIGALVSLFVMGSGTVDQIPHVIFVHPLSRELIDENLSIEERHCTAARC